MYNQQIKNFWNCWSLKNFVSNFKIWEKKEKFIRLDSVKKFCRRIANLFYCKLIILPNLLQKFSLSTKKNKAKFLQFLLGYQGKQKDIKGQRRSTLLNLPKNLQILRKKLTIEVKVDINLKEFSAISHNDDYNTWCLKENRQNYA